MKARTKLIGTIVLGAALLAPVAQAQRPDDRAGPRGPGAITAVQTAAAQHPDSRAGVRGPGATTAVESGAVRHPDNRAGVRGAHTLGPSDNLGASRHPDNRPDARGPGAVTQIVVEPASGGFDWRDALIGGLGGLGTALLLTGCLFLLLSQRARTRLA